MRRFSTQLMTQWKRNGRRPNSRISSGIKVTTRLLFIAGLQRSLRTSGTASSGMETVSSSRESTVKFGESFHGGGRKLMPKRNGSASRTTTRERSLPSERARRNRPATSAWQSYASLEGAHQLQMNLEASLRPAPGRPRGHYKQGRRWIMPFRIRLNAPRSSRKKNFSKQRLFKVLVTPLLAKSRGAEPGQHHHEDRRRAALRHHPRGSARRAGHPQLRPRRQRQVPQARRCKRAESRPGTEPRAA